MSKKRCFAAHCEWAPSLPCRLQKMHSHWLSRKKTAVILRGVKYTDRRTAFILTAPYGALWRLLRRPSHIKLMQCFCIPPHWEVRHPTPYCLMNHVAACPFVRVIGRASTTNLVCLRLQAQAWHRIRDATASFDMLWLLPGSGSSAAAMLARFEAEDFIHVTTQASDPVPGTEAPEHAAASFSPAILFNLPRYRLTFTLRPGGKQLWCSNYSGYHLPMKGDPTSPCATLPLTRFDTFLVLQSSEPSMPAKVLVPDGTLKRKEKDALCSVTASSQPDRDNLGHHVYTFNRRTLGFDTAVVPSRLFLAAVYAATHCDVPLPQLGMTGGEHALQLLRQSWVNRPLTGPEAAALSTLARNSLHTPALQLLCQAMLEDSESFAFLHMRPPQTSDCEARSQRDGHNLYEQDAKRTQPLPFVHVRQQLTKDEQHAVLSRAANHVRNGSARVAKRAQWIDVERECLTVDTAAADAVQSGSFHKRLLDLHHRHSAPAAQHGKCDVRIRTAHLLDDAFGQEVADDLEESMRVFQECPADMCVRDAPGLEKDLRAVLDDVNSAEQQLAACLLRALAFSTADEYGTAMTAFQVSGLMAQPALADLLAVTIFPETLSVCTMIKCSV